MRILFFKFLKSVLFPIRNATPPLSDHRKENILPLDSETLLVLKFSGWGSLLNLHPLLSSLRASYPKARLILVTFEKNREVSRHLRSCDKIVFLRDSEKESFPRKMFRILSLAWSIRRMGPQILLDMQLKSRKHLSLFLGLFSGATVRIGFAKGNDIGRLTLLTHPVYFNDHQPLAFVIEQIQLLLGLPKILTLPPSFTEPGAIRPETTHHNSFKSLNSQTTLIINPNASQLSYERRWPITHFSGAIQKLLSRNPDLQIILVGSAEEKDYVSELKGQARSGNDRLTNLAGTLSFDGLIYLLKRAGCFLTNDSGPLHLALMMGIPTVALFGPTRPDQVSIGYHPSRSIFLYESIYCSPCVHEIIRPPCGGDNQCMKALRIESVVRAVETLLFRKRTRIHPEQEWNPDNSQKPVFADTYPHGLFRDPPFEENRSHSQAFTFKNHSDFKSPRRLS